MSNSRFGAGNEQNDPGTSCHTRRQGTNLKKKSQETRMSKKGLEDKSQVWDNLNVKNNNCKGLKYIKHISDHKHTIITPH